MGRGILRGAGGDENLKFNFIWPYQDVKFNFLFFFFHFIQRRYEPILYIMYEDVCIFMRIIEYL